MPSDDCLTDLDDPDLDLDLDELIEQITVDAYRDEGYWSFRQAFEDHVDFPIETTVIVRGFDDAWSSGAQRYFDDVEIGLGLAHGWVRIVDVN